MEYEPRMHELENHNQCKVCGRRMQNEGDVMTNCPGPPKSERIEALITLFGVENARS